ncbi:MAG: anti-sigma factor family protein [Alphaproteobacteria bacterium]
MDCKQAQKLIDGYMDGELDLVSNLEIERHFQECALCSQAYEDRQALRTGIKASAPYFKAPEELQKRLQSSLRKEAKAEAAVRLLRRPWVSVAAPLAAAAIVVLALVPLLKGPPAEELLAREVLDGHIRSLMADHLSDVASSDRHTVKPWFNGKLDFSPPVEDLAQQGFPLVGGRLDYLNRRPVAALVYHRQKHFINLFIWPATGSDSDVKKETRQGYHLFHWTRSGMTYWAVSDVEESQLQAFVRQVQNQVSLSS